MMDPERNTWSLVDFTNSSTIKTDQFGQGTSSKFITIFYMLDKFFVFVVCLDVCLVVSYLTAVKGLTT